MQNFSFRTWQNETIWRTLWLKKAEGGGVIQCIYGNLSQMTKLCLNLQTHTFLYEAEKEKMSLAYRGLRMTAIPCLSPLKSIV